MPTAAMPQPAQLLNKADTRGPASNCDDPRVHAEGVELQYPYSIRWMALVTSQMVLLLYRILHTLGFPRRFVARGAPSPCFSSQAQAASFVAFAAIGVTQM